MTVLGIVVLAAGATLLAVEAHVPAAGLIASAGAAALVAGAALAVVGAGGGAIVAVAVAALVGALAVAGVLAVVRSHSDVRRWLPRGGASGLEGRIATVRNWNGEHGRVFVDGALWRARDELSEPVTAGDQVVVDRVHGLTLTVRRAERWELQP